jgi:ribosomal protein S18 acetylase RimI-like enzyme
MRVLIANDKHIPDIIELWKELMDFHKNIDAHWSRGKDGHIAYEKLLREMLESEDATILVAVDNGRTVGYSCLRIAKPPPALEQHSYGVIDATIVTSDYRRRGIGELMLDRALEWFSSRNVNRIELSVAAKNQLGYSFWEKHGFQDYQHRLYLER